MRVLIPLTLLLLCAAKVHYGQESPACPRKESSSGVLMLKLGSEVILGCKGDITVDSVPLVMGTKHKERLENRGDVNSDWKNKKSYERPGISGKHQPGTKNISTSENYKIKYATGKDAKVNESVPTAYPAMDEYGGTQVSQAVDQATKPNRKPNSVGRLTKGVAFNVTMEMELRTTRSFSTGYEEDEDYEDNVEGLRVTRSIKRQAQWTWNGKHIRNGGALKLTSLQLTDSGNYSCYRRGKLVSSVKISVGIPPESPTLSCYKKSHNSKIRCEWLSRQPIIPQPQCYLLLKKGLQNKYLVNCSYSATRFRCWCVLPSEMNDRHFYTAKLCVTNTLGNATSSLYKYTPPNIIKPDPPAQVIVTQVMGQPHTLKVTWSLPATWQHSAFFLLHFQLIYRPVHGKEYQKVNISDSERLWLISDALPHIQYEIQIRAKDEYDGQWSEWTRPVYANTWTAPETTIIPDIYASLGPVSWTFPEGSGGSEAEVDIKPATDGDDVIWAYALCVGGVFLLISIIIISVYTLRHRMPLQFKKKKESVSSTCSCSSPSPLLQQPQVIHSSSHQEGEGEGIHLHNMDYFFSHCDSYNI